MCVCMVAVGLGLSVEVRVWSVDRGRSDAHTTVWQAGCLHRGSRCPARDGPHSSQHGHYALVSCLSK